VEKPQSDTESENARSYTSDSRKNFMSCASFKAGVNLPSSNKEQSTGLFDEGVQSQFVLYV
jgi:hypothetical protein